MSFYCSLDEAKGELKATTNVDNTKMMQAIWDVSRRIDRELSSDYPVFAPNVGTWEVLITSDRVNSYNNTLDLGMTFQSVSAVSLSGTALVIGTDVKGYPNTSAPYSHLRMTGYTYNWYNRVCLDCDDDPLTLSITGVRGFRRRSGTAWLKVDDVALAMTSSVTSLKVADIDGSDPRGFSPRLSPGNLIRIVTGGATEYMNILTPIDTSANTSGLERGVNGSTAIAHDVGDDIEVWQVEDVIKRITARQAAFLFTRRGAFEGAVIQDVGTVTFPQDLLMELRAALSTYQYEAL